MSKSPGSVFGGVLLIAGSCIGAGMLGLPVQTGLSGFLPSLAMFLVAWGFMTLSGFLLIEVNSWYPSHVNLLTMISKGLGPWGRYIGWVFYLFLFYALLVAYMAASGNILSHFLKTYIGLSIPPYTLTTLFVFIFGVFIYKGTKVVDHANRVLMIFKISAFLLVLLLGIQFIKPTYLTQVHSKKMFSSLPILIIAFGFHNMIPSLTHYMKGDIKKVKKTILGGSLLSLTIYLLWQILVLGIIPLKGPTGLEIALASGKEASQMLSEQIAMPTIGVLAQLLGFFAILTSFLAQSLSLSHFLQDGFALTKTSLNHLALCLLTLFPPLLLAIFYPDLFYIALNFAGGICTMVLFGIIPSLMVWKGRYICLNKPTNKPLPGGKVLILLMLFFATSVFFYELFAFSKTLIGFL